MRTVISAIFSLSLVGCDNSVSGGVYGAYSNFVFGTPAELRMNEDQQNSIAVQKFAGSAPFVPGELRIKTTGTASCGSPSLLGSLDQDLSLILAGCTGDGRVHFSYRDKKSLEVLVANSHDVQLLNPLAMSANADRSRLYLLDQGLKAIVEVDVASGRRTLVSGSGLGTGTSFAAPVAIAVNKSGTVAYVVDSTHGLFAVELADGNRSVLSSGILSSTSGIVLNSPETFAYAMVGSELLKIDLTNGLRETVSKLGVAGSGPDFSSPLKMRLSRDDKKMYVLGTSNTIYLVDMILGHRKLVTGGSSPVLGSGVTWSGASDIELGVDDKNLFVLGNTSSFCSTAI